MANLVKNIMGSGLLSLSAGVAAFSGNPFALVPATLYLVMPLGLLSAYTFYLIARHCVVSKTESFGDAWGELVGKNTSWVISLFCFMDCFVGCVCYTMIAGDTLSTLLAAYVGPFFASRSRMILLLTVGVFYPLSRMRNLKPLAKFSMIGTGGLLYTTFFMAARYVLGSYAPHGPLRGPLLAQPPVASAPLNAGFGMLLLASMLSTSYMAHFNAPRLYTELRTPKSGTKLQRFGLVVFVGFMCTVVLHALVMGFGFLTFGSAAQGNILDNYAASDIFAAVAKGAVALSVIFGHPLQFVGCQDALESLLGRSPKWASYAVLAGMVTMSLLARDLGIVQGVKGAVVSIFLVFVAPSVMAVFSMKTRAARWSHAALAGLGVVLSVSGLGLLVKSLAA